MLKKSRKTISVLVAIALLFNLSFSYSTAIIAPETAVTSKNKISEELAIVMETMDDDDTVSVMVWFEDIDTETISTKAEKSVGYTQEDIKKAEDAVPAINEAVFDLSGTAYTKAINDYKEATKAERLEVLKMQNDLTYTKRHLFKEAYSKNNAEQARTAEISESSITYKSFFSPVVVVNLTSMEIIELSEKNNIVYIGFNDNTAEKDELSYAMSAIQADYTRNTLGFDGYGVKVGIYDGGNIASHSELSSSQITNIYPNGTTSQHATKVARIICGSNGVAPNAQVFATYVTEESTKMIEVERLINQGVSVINYSKGTTRGSSGYYTDYEKWIDHVAYQHKVTIVKSAGNGGVGSDVTIPGLAYNVITVGGTDTKLTNNRSDDTMYNVEPDKGSASANGGTLGCAKPDFLAPAVMWSGGTEDRGTSFAAPMVTGLIAQMIEYKPTIATNPALIKAILTVSTDKKVLPGGNSAVSEEWAGTITAQQGAGQVNAKNAMSTLGKNRYATGTMSSGTISKTFTVSSSDSWIRYSVAWTRRNTISSSHTGGDYITAVSPNLKLQVYNPSNTSMGLSNISTSSVELVHFTVGTTGSHTAKITRMDSGTNTFDYAVAWH